jgi:hypothetical protein
LTCLFGSSRIGLQDVAHWPVSGHRSGWVSGHPSALTCLFGSSRMGLQIVAHWPVSGQRSGRSAVHPGAIASPAATCCQPEAALAGPIDAIAMSIATVAAAHNPDRAIFITCLSRSRACGNLS